MVQFVHFCGSLIWNKLSNLVKPSRLISEFKNIIKKIGNIDYGCMKSGTLHTSSQYPRNYRSSLCPFGSGSYQSLDSL